MEHIAELHVHSKYAGACSDKLTLENIDATAKTKGIGIIGTGDFTHPEWFKQMRSTLVSHDNGLFSVPGSNTGVKFVVSGEVCTIFAKNKSGKAGVFDRTGNVAKIHHGILLPDLESAEQVNERLVKYGSLGIDGRPQLGMTASELVETVMSVNSKAFIFAAHAWTPWFGVFGSMGGFDSIEEAYGDQAKHIHALETGLSSDPAMNWRISKLDKYALISGGDAHSLPKLGREATVFEMEEKKISYDAITSAIKEKRIKYTIEFYPEEGKYHFDGHRKCNISLSPSQARKYNGICPVCRKKLTIGVLHRIEELADREEGYTPKNAVPFVHAVPLREIIAYVSGKGEASVYVMQTYEKLLNTFGTEMNVLLKSDPEAIRGVDKELATAIENVREGKVNVTPGYDGVFGIVDISNKIAKAKGSTQKTIGEF